MKATTLPDRAAVPGLSDRPRAAAPDGHLDISVLRRIVDSGPTGSSPIPREVLAMLEATEDVRCRDVSVGWALRVSYHAFLRDRLAIRRSLPGRLRALLEPLALVARNLLRGIRARPVVDQALESIPRSISDRALLVCDGSGHTEDMARDLLQKFGPQEVVVLSSNSQVAERFRGRFSSCVDVHEVLTRFDWRLVPGSLRLYARLVRRLPRRPPALLAFLLPRVLALVQAVRFYERLFESARPPAVVTLCDSHWHEFVITECARRRGLPTCTNLHGDPAVLIDLIPIASDRVFVWGDRSREHLIENGVPAEQVLVSGNPKFDRVFASFLPRRAEIRATLLARLGMPPEGPVVTFLSSGLLSTAELTEEVAFTLFRAFASALGGRGTALVKLHPHDDPPELYRSWMDRLGMGSAALLREENLFEVLAATDIAVTFHSTTGLEAIGFGIPTLLLNIIPRIDVKEYITYASEAIECRSEEELRTMLGDLVTRPDRLRSEIERTLAGRRKYFANSPEFNCSQFIHESILGHRDR
jgi:hypothetical protein